MGNERELMVKAEGITKSFGNNLILKGVDLSVNKGDVVVIIGPSGAGKTTFLRCLNYLEKPDSGHITIAGHTLMAEKASKRDIVEHRRRTAMVFQQYNLFKHKTALENVEEGLIHVQNKSADEAAKIGREYLDMVGLSEKYDSYPAKLSGGQQQRVGIARALALHPDVILFDEPTSALDPEWVNEVLEVMRKIAGTGITMIVVTHEIQFALDIATKIVVMDEGLIIETGTPKEILTNAQHERTRSFLSKIINNFTYMI